MSEIVGPSDRYQRGATLYVGPETSVVEATSPRGPALVIKLSRSAPATPAQEALLRHEAAVLGVLAGIDGVVRLQSVEDVSGHVALVLEHAGAWSLAQVLRERGRLPVETAVRLALHLARALDGVHQAGVVHKDVKPQNIIVDRDVSRATLVDFGLASRLAFEATTPLIPEALEGTLAYISPEQTGRTARALDGRTDLYSLGVTLFEMLAGRRPFVETDALALVHAHLAVSPPALDALEPGVPRTLARIVERLLAKTPEDRYQTARGVAHDLERALTGLRQRGRVEDFSLGEKDFSPRLYLPETLVGRSQEVQAVAAAFRRAAAGAVEVLLIGGPSGIGKTALVRSVYREIAQERTGLLLAGKHDQLGRATPYAALSQALGGLMSDIAASPQATFVAWRARFEAALGANARVIADVVPELEWVMGSLPPVAEVPTEMAYNRIKLSWIELVRAVTDASPPLVLFLDDMQWADAASLELLKVLLTDVGREKLLVIAAYRDNEVEPGHPLWSLVGGVESTGVPTPRVALGPLDDEMVRDWLAVALESEPAKVAPLAQALRRRTDGNPFFLGQLLLELANRKMVRRNVETGAWDWNLEALAQVVTDDVVELMRGKVEKLALPTQELLGIAACVGHTFSLSELRVLTGSSAAQLTEALWPALVEGLVVPSGREYRDAHALAAQDWGTGAELDASYHFLHDRVQQAFYERIAPEQRASSHLRIGRRLESAYEREGGTDQSFLELVRHLYAGASAIESHDERKALAKLGLRAARAAKRSGSHDLVVTLVEEAQALLGAAAWQEEPQLSVELALERIEAAYMLRDFAGVHRLAATLLAVPLPALPRLAAQELRVRACVAAGDYTEGERLGVAALEEQGIAYPERNEACLTEASEHLRWLEAWVDEHPRALSEMPLDPSLEHMLVDAIGAMMLICAAFGNRPALAALVVPHCVRRSCERGSLTAIAPFQIGLIAHALSSVHGEYRNGIRWAREGERAARRLGSPFLPECLALIGMFTVYEAPAESAREPLRAAFAAARATGSFQGTSWALMSELWFLDAWAGRPLHALVARERELRELMTRGGDAIGRHNFELTVSFTAFLGSSEAHPPPGDESWLEAGPAAFLAAGDGMAAEQARIAQAHLHVVFGEHARALACADEAEIHRTAVWGTAVVTEIPLWRGIAHARCASDADGEGRAADISVLSECIARMRYLAEGCAENFGHKLRLLEAEHARVEGRIADAMAGYEDAIEQAHAHGFLHVEALAAQLCGEHHLELGGRLSARHFLERACDAYVRWGARRAVAFLRARHADLLSSEGATRARPGLSRAFETTTHDGSARSNSVLLDVETSVRSAQALASELSSERVAARLMELVAKNAGAQRAALLLAERGKDDLRLVARLDASHPDQVRTGLSTPLAARSDLSPAIVELARRSAQPLVLADARRDPRFAGEPGIAGSEVRSVLVAPLTHQGRVAGVLYLEHDAPAAFTAERVALVTVLASHSAIALENAELYAAQAAHAQQLERQVAERTRELRAALERLQDELAEAAAYMRDLLPPPIADGGPVATDWLFVPNAELGGDAFDYFWLDEDHLALYVLDVCGHGVGSALLSLAALRSIRGRQLPGTDLHDPASVLASLNVAFAGGRDSTRYFTMWYGVYDRRTGRLRYGCAAHPPALLFEPGGRMRELDEPGPMLGVVPEARFGARELLVERGSRLFLLTDGVYEVLRPDGSFLPFAEVVAELGRPGPRHEVLARTLELARAARGRAALDDDFTLLAVDFRPRP